MQAVRENDLTPNRDTTQIHVSHVVMRPMMTALPHPPRMTHHDTTSAPLSKKCPEGLTAQCRIRCTDFAVTTYHPIGAHVTGNTRALSVVQFPKLPPGHWQPGSHFNASWLPAPTHLGRCASFGLVRRSSGLLARPGNLIVRERDPAR